MKRTVNALELYKSSAGSGKTTALARQYIVLLYPEVKNFREILAVTFTNKATEEVKERILHYLYQLCSYEPDGKPTPIKLVFDDLNFRLQSDYPDKSQIWRTRQIQRLADKALLMILQDYDRFGVSTIDSFFQTVLRAFTRELDLSYGYNIELDTQKVLKAGIERLFATSDTNPTLQNHLVRFYIDRMEEKGTWTIEKNIETLAGELFNEQNKLFSRAEPLAPEPFERYHNNIQNVIRHYEENIVRFAEAWFTVLDHYDLGTKDFNYGIGGFANFFNKCLNKEKDIELGVRIMDVFDGKAEWYSAKSEKKALITQAKEGGAGQILTEAVSFVIVHQPFYQVALSIKKHIYSHAALNDLHRALEDHLRDNDLILNSQTGEKVFEIVSQTDAPFIYEKTGNKYKHFLLDEFQDTSTEQWQNLKPLLENGLSAGGYSMIVGDVKQAIYRWRGGNIDLLLHQVKDDLYPFRDRIKNKNLDSNYRSAVNVIRFNNTLFHHLASAKNAEYFGEAYGQYVREVYADSTQKFTKGKEENPDAMGYVHIEFLATNKESKINDLTPARILEVIRAKKEQHYAYRDIAVLVRNKKEAQTVAEYLINEGGIPIVSDESLQVSRHSIVRLLVQTMRFLLQPDDSVAVTEASFLYRNHVLKKPFTAADWERMITFAPEYNENNENKREHVSGTALARAFLPKDIAFETDYLSRFPLTELIEELIARYGLTEFANAYVLRFCDLVLEFLAEGKGNAHLSGFLDWWDETGKSKTITLSDKEDAVRILTIHKSKGLEFPVVILPYADWNLFPETTQNKVPRLWIPAPIQGQEDDLSHFRIPIDYKEDWLKDEFRTEATLALYEASQAEKIQSLTDNLNLFYVATTRAVRELWVFAEIKKEPSEKKGKKNAPQPVKKINELLFALLDRYGLTDDAEAENKLFYLHFDEMRPPFDDDAPLIWSVGTEGDPRKKAPAKDNKETKKDGLISETSLQTLERLPAFEWRSRMVVKPSVAATSDLTSLLRHVGHRTFPVQQILKKMSAVPMEEIEWQALVLPLAYEGLIRHSESEAIITQVKDFLAHSSVAPYFTKDKALVKDKKIILPKNDDGYEPHRLVKSTADNRYYVMDFRTTEQKEQTTRLRQYGKALHHLTQAPVTLLEFYVAPPFVVKEVKL